MSRTWMYSAGKRQYFQLKKSLRRTLYWAWVSLPVWSLGQGWPVHPKVVADMWEEGRGSCINAKHHQLQWHLSPQAEMLRLITHFTHSCKASRQGQTWISMSCVVWQEPAAKHLLQSHALHTGGGLLYYAFSSLHIWRPLGWRYLHRETARVLCCGWHLSWVAFLHCIESTF